MILAVLGFLPGLASASAIYALLAHATDLPFGMDVGRSLTVFVGTLKRHLILRVETTGFKV